MSKAKILIIDDEQAIRKLLRITLESQDFEVTEAATAKEGLIMAANHPPSVVLLDIGLPDINGQEVLQQLREWFTGPILILSVQHTEEDIITALDNGANDYLVKPFRTGELLARIRSAIRSGSLQEHIPVIQVGELQLDLAARTLTARDIPVKLTATEYQLITLFMKHAGSVLTHHYLLKEIWGPGYINQSQYLRVFIAQLRKKIESDPNRPAYILTEPGVGYRFMSS